MTDDPILPERRRSVRHYAMKAATIILDDGQGTLPCFVRETSTTGARLKVGPGVDVPDGFQLQIGNKPPRACHVVWKGDRQLGVAFN